MKKWLEFGRSKGLEKLMKNWIKYPEKKPRKKDGKYLVTIENKRGKRITTVAEYSKRDDLFIDENNDFIDVIAWQEYPKPYEG